MRAQAVAHSTAQAEALAAQCVPLQRHWLDGLAPTEIAFIAGIRTLLTNGLTEECNGAAKKFLEVAPTAKAVRRRAYALLRLAGAGSQ